MLLGVNAKSFTPRCRCSNVPNARRNPREEEQQRLFNVREAQSIMDTFSDIVETGDVSAIIPQI